MIDLTARRRFFAEEIEAVANLRSRALVEALASVPREQFLPPGPWVVRGESDFAGPPRETPDADPRHLYHNIGVAIDPARQLFNGQPSVIATAIDALALAPGKRVLHIGCGLGYYTALMAHSVGRGGRVVAVEVDAALAAEARANLRSTPWVDVRRGDGSGPLGESFDGILVNAGVTHPLETWLDALAPGARMVVPLTAAMGPTLGKGVMVLLTNDGDGSVLAARGLTPVAIYSAVGLRDEGLNGRLGPALARSFFPHLTRLRRDRHDEGPACWLHAPTFCLQSGS